MDIKMQPQNVQVSFAWWGTETKFSECRLNRLYHAIAWYLSLHESGMIHCTVFRVFIESLSSLKVGKDTVGKIYS